MLGPVELVDEVDSTNRVLLERARAGAPHGVVLVADHQTAGRGRLGRTWEAAPGRALLVSVLLRPRLPPASAHLLTFAAGLAAGDAAEGVSGFRPALKWPNDLIVERDGETRKLAGLLAESIVEGDDLSAVVVGMGFNLVPSEGVPEGAVSLEELAGRAITRDVLLDAWLRRLDERYAQLEDGASGLLADYRGACSTIGRTVRVDRGDRVDVGAAVDVESSGGLVFEHDGLRETVLAGDVVHLRAV